MCHAEAGLPLSPLSKVFPAPRRGRQPPPQGGEQGGAAWHLGSRASLALRRLPPLPAVSGSPALPIPVSTNPVMAPADSPADGDATPDSDSSMPSPKLPTVFRARLGRAADPKPPRPTPKPTVAASIPLTQRQGRCAPYSDTDSDVMPRQEGRMGNPHGQWWPHEQPELFRWAVLIAFTGIALTYVFGMIISSQTVRRPRPPINPTV